MRRACVAPTTRYLVRIASVLVLREHRECKTFECPVHTLMSEKSQITDPEAIEPYVLGGRATVTVVSKTTGTRFTYRVEQKRVGPREAGETDEQYDARKRAAQDGPRFVKVLTGTDNENHYTYVGHIDEGRTFRLDRRSQFGATAPSVSAWRWFWSALRAKSTKLEQCEVWHDGRCSRCGRKLTVPESVASGLGPICAAA